MANAAVTWNVRVNEDSGGSLAARVRNPDAAYITQATVSSISARYHRIDKSEAITATALTVASVVFDTLQTNTFWKGIDGVLVDSIGYNFRWDFGASVFTEPGIYGVTLVFTPSSGAAYNVNVKVAIEPRVA